jgi:hypothetical protein
VEKTEGYGQFLPDVWLFVLKLILKIFFSIEVKQEKAKEVL